MWKAVFVLCASVALATAQYGSDDDSAASSQQQQLSWEAQQKVSALPQYDASPAEESAYGSAPTNNLQNNYNNPAPQSGAPSQQQNYWWLNKNAFQKPANHPGLEPLQQQQPQQQRPQQPQPKPFPQQSNRNPNSYNAPAPSQNSYNQPQQKPNNTPFRQPTNNQFQQNSPSFGTQSGPSNSPSNGGGWTGPQQSQKQPSSVGFNAPAPSNPVIKPATFECMLLNKADCHKSNQFQQPLALPEESSGYNNNAQKPQQNYQPPPQPQQQYQPEQQPARPFTPQQPQEPVQNPPPGYYQPPSPQPKPQIPNQFQNSPQNIPQNQNYQPQFTPNPQPASSFPVNIPSPPKPFNNFQQPRPKPVQLQQQPYNRPLQNQQQSQNNAQSLRPTPNNNFDQQRPVAYDDQLPYPGCPAAMLCVPDDRCNRIGVIEETPLQLSESEKIFRVALSKCSEPGTGVEGVCCRDPNYKDPWPDMQMQGKGAGDHHHHHSDKGQAQPQQSAFQSSSNGFQQQQPQQAPQKQIPSRNPYAAFNRGNASASSSFSLAQKQRNSSGFETCSASEICVISYKCQQPSRRTRTTGDNVSQTSKARKCNEDIFKNPYVCCQEDPVKSPTTTGRPRLPVSQSTKYKVPVKFSFIPRSTTTPIPPTFEPITTTTPKKLPFRNNLLTNTLSPYLTDTSTDSPLISGIGLRFHSHLHTKPAIEANKAKRNPYNEESPAIIPLDRPTTYKPSYNTFQTSSTFRPLLLSNTERASNSIELLSSPSNQKLVNQSTSALNISSDNAQISHGTKNVPNDSIMNATIASAGTSSNSTLTSLNQANSTKPNAEIFEAVDVKKVPEPVPLKEELSKSPPAGFIFKGDNLYLPEIDTPSQNFLPPLYDFGRKSLEELIVENSTTTEATTEIEQNETTTMMPFSEAEE